MIDRAAIEADLGIKAHSKCCATPAATSASTNGHHTWAIQAYLGASQCGSRNFFTIQLAADRR
jgi:hypothetical protein